MKSALILVAVLALPVHATDTYTGPQTFKTGGSTISPTITTNLNFKFQHSRTVATISENGKTITWIDDDIAIEAYMAEPGTSVLVIALWELEKANRMLKKECSK